MSVLNHIQPRIEDSELWQNCLYSILPAVNGTFDSAVFQENNSVTIPQCIVRIVKRHQSAIPFFPVDLADLFKYAAFIFLIEAAVRRVKHQHRRILHHGPG